MNHQFAVTPLLVVIMIVLSLIFGTLLHLLITWTTNRRDRWYNKQNDDDRDNDDWR